MLFGMFPNFLILILNIQIISSLAPSTGLYIEFCKTEFKNFVTFKNSKTREICLPNDVIYTNNILLLRVLRRTNDGGARLHPSVSAKLVHYPIVVCQHLALVHY